MNNEAIRDEAEKLVRHRDRVAPDNVLVGDVVALVTRAVREEREECAKVCEELTKAEGRAGVPYHQRDIAFRCAIAIRERGIE